ncbi:hypothetical protein PGT21_021381 [Puccinia graminis f. sp. tritici]|uniref:Uncharacterized protein n=1 Tax=Puccinia graminis f. sp. tritici TaxID=56615 RepID=A0A5B0QV83_PUCGR|nr:hypothetical protein PGT21_021381 [Puccinia graminis f. sp. tritici]
MQIFTWLLFPIINLVTSVINTQLPFKCPGGYFEVCTRHATPEDIAQLVSGKDKPSRMAMVAPLSKEKPDFYNCAGETIANIIAENANCCYGDRKDFKGFFHLMEEDMHASNCDEKY